MTREIKFKVKDGKGNLIYFNMQELYLHACWECSGLGGEKLKGFKYDFDVNNAVQYTGIKDKNGTEIYEGDIIKKYNPFTEIVCIKWNKPTVSYVFATQFNTILGSGGDDLDWINTKSHMDTDIEVIGNIYENKELLEDNIE